MTVAYSSIGTGANGGATVAPTCPATVNAGDGLLLVVTSGATNDETPQTPSGWELLGTYTCTDGSAFGVDNGPRRVTVFWKIAVGNEDGTTVTVTITNGNTCRGTILSFTKTLTNWRVECVGGNDNTNDTTPSAAAGSAINWAVGDITIVAAVQNPDSATQSAQSLTASGITFGTRTNRSATAVVTGNDHRHSIDTFAATSAGSGAQTPTWAYGAFTASVMAFAVVRLRDVSYAATGSGGLAVAGAAQTSFPTRLYAGSGGLAVAGAATTTKLIVKSYTVSGGLTLAGAFSSQYVSGVALPWRHEPQLGGVFREPTYGHRKDFLTRRVHTWWLAATGISLLDKSWTGTGGFVVAGSAAVTKLVVKTYAPSGGFQVAGAAAISRLTIKTYVPSGGFAVAGTSPWNRTRSFAPSGGLVVAGAGTTQFTGSTTRSYTGTGGMTLAGAAALAKIKSFLASGGVTLAGSFLRARTRVAIPAGGLTVAGAATTLKLVIRIYVPSGGVAIAGAFARARTRVFVVAGGLTIAGAFARARVKAWLASGGVQTGGAGTTQFDSGGIRSYTGTGGMTIAGAAILAKIKAKIGAGVITLAGAAATAVTHLRAWIGTGGVTVAGAATRSRVKAWQPAGGIALSGTALVARVKRWQSSGGLLLAGAGATSFTGANVRTYLGTGGLVIAGAAILARVRVWLATATGLQLGGAAATSKLATRTYTGSGQFTIAGSATYNKQVVRNYVGGGAFVVSGYAPVAYVRTYTGYGTLYIAGSALTQFRGNFDFFKIIYSKHRAWRLSAHNRVLEFDGSRTLRLPSHDRSFTLSAED